MNVHLKRLTKLQESLLAYSQKKANITNGKVTHATLNLADSVK